VPKLGKIYVGDWNDDVTSALEVTGLRNPAWEDFAETCGPGLRTLASGRAVIDVEGDSEIDEEGAWLFLDFELDRMLVSTARPGLLDSRLRDLPFVRPGPAGQGPVGSGR
jgi:hypothetical protein